MKNAICIRCGHPKKRSYSRCPNCSFAPKSDRDLAKSMMLSLDYQVGEQYLARSWEELLEIGVSLSKGEYQFDEKEVEELTKDARKSMDLPAIEQIKMIGIPFLFIAVMIIVAVILYKI